MQDRIPTRADEDVEGPPERNVEGTDLLDDDEDVEGHRFKRHQRPAAARHRPGRQRPLTIDTLSDRETFPEGDTNRDQPCGAAGGGSRGNREGLGDQALTPMSGRLRNRAAPGCVEQ